MANGDWTPRSPDFSVEYRQQASQLARRYAIMEGVVGVALVGGLTFGEADRYSAVELIVYLQEQSLRTWYLGEAPLPEGESRYHGLALNVSYRDFRAEQSREWAPAERWRVSRAELLYDPEGVVQQLLDEKANLSEQAFVAQALEYASQIRYLLNRSVPAWLYRGNPLAAHHVLNRATDQFVGLVHLVNGEHPPADDWNGVLLDQLAWTPENLRERIVAAMTVSELTATEASRRRHALYRLVHDCWQYLIPDEPPEDRVQSFHQARMLREVVRRGNISLKEYRERYEVSLLIQSPAFDLLSVRRGGPEPQIVFDFERLNQLIDHELGRFLDYQQRLLRELAATTGSDVDS